MSKIRETLFIDKQSGTNERNMKTQKHNKTYLKKYEGYKYIWCDRQIHVDR